MAGATSSVISRRSSPAAAGGRETRLPCLECITRPSCPPPSVPEVFRRQLPVYSPVSWQAIWAGIGAALSTRSAAAAREQLTGLIKQRFDASDVLLTDSGTAALRLAIAGAARANPGSCTALPAYCCYDVATAADGARVSPG